MFVNKYVIAVGLILFTQLIAAKAKLKCSQCDSKVFQCNFLLVLFSLQFSHIKIHCKFCATIKKDSFIAKGCGEDFWPNIKEPYNNTIGDGIWLQACNNKDFCNGDVSVKINIWLSSIFMMFVLFVIKV